jgi:hypothetical protein
MVFKGALTSTPVVDAWSRTTAGPPSVPGASSTTAAPPSVPGAPSTASVPPSVHATDGNLLVSAGEALDDIVCAEPSVARQGQRVDAARGYLGRVRAAFASVAAAVAAAEQEMAAATLALGDAERRVAEAEAPEAWVPPPLWGRNITLSCPLGARTTTLKAGASETRKFPTLDSVPSRINLNDLIDERQSDFELFRPQLCPAAELLMPQTAPASTAPPVAAVAPKLWDAADTADAMPAVDRTLSSALADLERSFDAKVMAVLKRDLRAAKISTIRRLFG